MKRILVIEDDETVREVLRSFLGQKGFEVTLAQNGESGLDLLRAEKFDLVFTDLVMPGISGMEVLKEVVASKIAVPVVVMTAFGTVQTAVEAMRIGAFDYITKPFKKEELYVKLNNHIQLKQFRDLFKKYTETDEGPSPSVMSMLLEFEKIFDSQKIGIEKPDPEIFQEVLKELELSPSQVIYIGDYYEVDVKGANRAGIRRHRFFGNDGR